VPVLEIEMVVANGEALPASLAASLADAAGEVFGSKAGQTWVRLRALAAGEYAENGGDPASAPRPVFVSVLQADPPQGEELRLQVDRLTVAIARVCALPPENVHLVYQASARGRVAFGGRLVGGSGAG
jgi:phenylpyruvate tautomerase PptA (4-oxalocrotonate tautomerase family)